MPGLSEIAAEKARRRAEGDRLRVERDAGAIRERCKTFVGFVREAWHVVEPTKPYIYGWHHAAIGEHYEAVTRGEIHHLAVNQPPNTSKSTLLSVMAPAYEWANGRPGLKFLTTSYKEGYARRDSRSMRDLVMSEWFQALWPEVVVTRDNEVDFENTARGGRRAVAFASLTSGHGDRVILDDPHSTETVESETERAAAVRIFRESLPSRGINPATDAAIIIMHRLHMKDICGAIDEYGMDYVRLVLPMEYDPRTVVVTRWFKDPRTRAGELLWPERFGPEFIDNLKNGGHLSSHAYATQYQQQPTARSGGMFKRHWFQVVDAPPADATAKVRRWDLAATEGDGDWTAGVLMSRARDQRFYIEDVVRFRESGIKVRRAIQTTASQDGRACRVVIPQDPGQAGKDQAASIVRENPGASMRAERETGSKATRAEPLAAQCEAGNVLLVRGPWNEGFIDELCSFPNGAADDQLDAAAGAFNALVEVRQPVRYTAERVARIKALTARQRNM